MAYSTSAPPMLIGGTLTSSGSATAGTGRKLWFYTSTDAATSVDASGYFTNGYDLGMRSGDIVISIDVDASPVAATIHIVNVSGTTINLGDGVAITATNSD